VNLRLRLLFALAVVGCNADKTIGPQCSPNGAANSTSDFVGLGGIVTITDSAGHVAKAAVIRGETSVAPPAAGCVVRTFYDWSVQPLPRHTDDSDLTAPVRIRCQLSDPGNAKNTVDIDVSLLASYKNAPSLWAVSGVALSSTSGADACKTTKLAAQSTNVDEEGAVLPLPAVGAPLRPTATTPDFRWSFRSNITASIDESDSPQDAAVSACAHPLDVTVDLTLTYDASSFHEADLGQSCDL